MGAIILWSREEEFQLKTLFGQIIEGAYRSHREIGGMIGKTRNAVIGKIHRLKLTRDPLVGIRGVDHRVAPCPTQKEDKVSSIQLYGRRGPSKAPQRSLVTCEPITGPSPHAVSMVEVKDKQCHFPMGHVGQEGFHLCGGPITQNSFGADSPYCEFHHRVCYYPPKPARRDYVSGNKY